MGTALGIRTGNGIVISSDRISVRNGRIVSKETNKLRRIADHVGSAFSEKPRRIGELKAQARIFEFERRKPMPIRGLARRLASFARELQMKGIIGGLLSKSELYRVDPDGLTKETKFSAVGRGAQQALGVLEAEYEPEVSLEDAQKLAIRALQAAERRETTTGGIDLAVIDEEGFRKLSDEEIEELRGEAKKRKA